MTVDTLTFGLVFVAACASSYLALRDTKSMTDPESAVTSRRGRDPDNVLTGGFAFVMWLVWAFLAQAVEVNPQTGSVESFIEFTVIGVGMAVIMFLGLLEEVFDWSVGDFFSRARGDR